MGEILQFQILNGEWEVLSTGENTDIAFQMFNFSSHDHNAWVFRLRDLFQSKKSVAQSVKDEILSVN